MEQGYGITQERRIDWMKTLKDIGGQAIIMFVNGVVFAAGTHTFTRLLPGKGPGEVIPMRKVG